MKIYTKTGDKGTTSLLNGARVSKYHPRLHAYGTVDELNSWIGLLREYADQEVTSILIDVQNTLFAMGSHLAVEGEVKFEMPIIPADGIEKLEKAMDKIDEKLPALRNFILPGGHVSVANCHIARTVCRRAERFVVELADTANVEDVIVIYLNRLSDFLFVLSRKFAQDFNAEEIAWKPRNK